MDYFKNSLWRNRRLKVARNGGVNLDYVRQASLTPALHIVNASRCKLPRWICGSAALTPKIEACPVTNGNRGQRINFHRSSPIGRGSRFKIGKFLVQIQGAVFLCGVAQLVEPPPHKWKRVGSSPTAAIFAPLAQWIEQRFSKTRVSGSNPEWVIFSRTSSTAEQSPCMGMVQGSNPWFGSILSGGQRG